MNEQNNPLIIRGEEHTEEFDHREQDELLLTERDIKEGEVIPVFAGNTEIAISPLYLFRLAKEYGFFEAQLAKAKKQYEAQIIALQEIIQYLEQKIKDTKKPKRRIFEEADVICPHGGMGHFNTPVRKCDHCWQSLKNKYLGGEK